MDPYTWFSTPGDMATFKWIDIFVEASFYPIFAMLFGYGLNMQYEKSIANRIVICSGHGTSNGHFTWVRPAACIVHLVGGRFIHICAYGLYHDCVCQNSEEVVATIAAAFVYIVPSGIIYGMHLFSE